MYTDSVIAEDVMLFFLREGIIILPIHDSFIVRCGYELSLKAQMKVSFKKVVKTVTKVKAIGPLLPEHFYSKPKTESGGKIISGKDILDLFINRKGSICNSYLSSWYSWRRHMGFII